GHRVERAVSAAPHATAGGAGAVSAGGAPTGVTAAAPKAGSLTEANPSSASTLSDLSVSSAVLKALFKRIQTDSSASIKLTECGAGYSSRDRATSKVVAPAMLLA